MAIFAIVSTWNNIFASFLNGASKIKLQMYSSVIAMSINIPLSIFFAKNLELGSAGVILGTCVTLIFGAVLGPLQVYLILENRASGIWNK
jgi:Na+-driven multidrug efflux pump